MALVPTDLPTRLQRAGLQVQVLGGWESRGGSADQRAVVFHWTASSSSESPSSCANYVFTGSSVAPDYNLLIARDGVVWVGARLKANSSGNISHIARDEALAGRVDWRSAASRGLTDDTSANAQLFAISAQNNGVGEPWSPALVDAMARAAAVVLDALGLPRSSYVTHHAALTRRKIDLTAGTGGCPSGAEWNQRITDALQGGAPQPPPEVRDMWTTHKDCPPGTGRDNPGVLVLGLPANRKSATVTIYCPANPPDGASLWGAIGYVGTKQGLWSGGKTWEYWLPGQQSTAVALPASAQSVEVHYYGGSNSPVTVTLSGE